MHHKPTDLVGCDNASIPIAICHAPLYHSMYTLQSHLFIVSTRMRVRAKIRLIVVFVTFIEPYRHSVSIVDIGCGCSEDVLPNIVEGTLLRRSIRVELKHTPCSMILSDGSKFRTPSLVVHESSIINYYCSVNRDNGYRRFPGCVPKCVVAIKSGKG